MALSREERINAVRASFETGHPLCGDVRADLYRLEEFGKLHDRTTSIADRQRVAEEITTVEARLVRETTIIKHDVEAAVMRYGSSYAPLD